MLPLSPVLSFIAGTCAVVALLLVFNTIAVSISERAPPDPDESDWHWRIK
jgi:hypothetical protein